MTIGKDMSCHHCNEKIELVVTNYPGRHDSCPGCGYDLRCCFNCKFYDRSAANECLEHISERISDKERANFCDFFEPSEREGAFAQKVDVNDIAAKMAASFKALKK